MKIIKQTNKILICMLLLAMTLFSTTQATEDLSKDTTEKSKLESLKSIVVDQQVYFAGDALNDEHFGEVINISGIRAIIGAPGDDDNGTDSGSAYIFEYDGTTWNEVQKIVASNGLTGDRFGEAVSIDGDRAIVGARLRDRTGTFPAVDTGTAYIFELNNSGAWVEVKQLFPSISTNAGAHFGASVGISGDSVLVGAPQENTTLNSGAGSVYVYDFIAGIGGTSDWLFQEKFNAPTITTGDFFGGAISMDGQQALISAVLDDEDGTNAGAVYVYLDLSVGWTFQDKLLGSDSGIADGGFDEDRFGTSISLNGGTAVIGVPDDDLSFLGGTTSDVGSVYIFEKAVVGNNYNFKQKIRPTLASSITSARFGQSVSHFGNLAVFGKRSNEIDSAILNAGSAEAYEYNSVSTNWEFSGIVQRDTALGHHLKTNDRFGDAVAVVGKDILIGAIEYDFGTSTNNNNVGAFFHFVDNPDANGDLFSFNEDNSSNLFVLANDDANVLGDPITISAVTQPSNNSGQATIDASGAFIAFVPTADYCNSNSIPATDNFTYTINGGSTATVFVQIVCVDDAPVAVDDTAVVAQDSTAQLIAVTANDTDIDGGTKIISLDLGTLSQPANGIVTRISNTLIGYTPDSGYCNSNNSNPPDTFTYELNGGSSATVSVTVTCANLPPQAFDDMVTVIIDTTTNLDVLANDVDNEGDDFIITGVTQPANAAVLFNDFVVTYTPNSGYCNDGSPTDNFTYTINNVSTATVAVTIACNQPPVAVEDEIIFNEDAGSVSIPVLDNDFDPDGGDPITITNTTQPSDSNGSMLIFSTPTNPDVLIHTPEADYCNDGNPTDNIVYTINGGATAPLQMTVNCVNDAPSFNTLSDIVDVFGTITEQNHIVEISNFASIVDFGAANESGQSVLQYHVTINSDPSSIIQAVSLSSSGGLTIDFDFLQTGEAELLIKVQDDGGTANNGIDMSSEKSVIVRNTDTIFLDSFEKIAVQNKSFQVLDYLDSLTIENFGTELPVYNFDSDAIYYLQHSMKLNNDYQSDQMLNNVKTWLSQNQKEE